MVPKTQDVKRPPCAAASAIMRGQFRNRSIAPELGEIVAEGGRVGVRVMITALVIRGKFWRRRCWCCYILPSEFAASKNFNG